MNNIAALRRAQGLTQNQLAQNIHITQQALHRYEKGLQQLKLPVLKRLAAALDCTMEELAGSDGPLPPQQADFRQAAEFVLAYCRDKGLLQMHTVTEKDIAVMIVDQARRAGQSRRESDRHLDTAIAEHLEKFLSS